jgi:hypothetical protein
MVALSVLTIQAVATKSGIGNFFKEAFAPKLNCRRELEIKAKTLCVLAALPLHV